MPTTKRKEPVLQLTISLAEVDGLRKKVVDLERENGELRTDNAALKKQLHDLTEPAKQADAKAYRKKMGYD
jgi:regulator of replication initiation timing